MRRRAIVVGAGHNGLVTACYLAQAGWDVTVLEALDRPGGGSRTEETIPGHRFDLHSAAHNIINMTAIPEELELRQTGLRYLEMDPFSIAVREDQRHVRFHRSVEDTVASIAEHDPVEAEEYRTFVAVGDHLLDRSFASGVASTSDWRRPKTTGSRCGSRSGTRPTHARRVTRPGTGNPSFWAAGDACATCAASQYRRLDPRRGAVPRHVVERALRGRRPHRSSNSPLRSPP